MSKTIELADRLERYGHGTLHSTRFEDDCYDAAKLLRSLATIEAERDALKAQLAHGMKSFECFSVDDGCDFWVESPSDCELVDGKELGEKFELMCGWYAVRREYVVTKIPDETSDDYEVEPVNITTPPAPPVGAF